MKNRLFYFAACVALVLSSVSCSSDDGEEEDADIPVVGKIAVSGAYNVYSHGSQGWIMCCPMANRRITCRMLRRK